MNYRYLTANQQKKKTSKRPYCCVPLKYVLNDLPSTWTPFTNNFKQLRSEVFLRLVSERAHFFFHENNTKSRWSEMKNIENLFG